MMFNCYDHAWNKLLYCSSYKIKDRRRCFQIRYKETPKGNNSGEYITEHNHVKQGDIVLKYALTCAVRGAILANKNSSIKLFYRRISKKGVSPQKAQIAANVSLIFSIAANVVFIISLSIVDTSSVLNQIIPDLPNMSVNSLL
jgi:hypothetical protein